MSRPSAAAEAASLFGAIRDAYTRNDHAGFGAVVDDKMKAAIPPERFGATALTMGPILADAARISYMDVLKEGGHQVHFWKVDSGAARDILVRMSVRDGKVSGLLFSAAFDTALKARG